MLMREETTVATMTLDFDKYLETARRRGWEGNEEKKVKSVKSV